VSIFTEYFQFHNLNYFSHFMLFICQSSLYLKKICSIVTLLHNAICSIFLNVASTFRDLQNFFSFYGTLFPDPLLGLCPRTWLGDLTLVILAHTLANVSRHIKYCSEWKLEEMSINVVVVYYDNVEASVHVVYLPQTQECPWCNKSCSYQVHYLNDH